MTHTPRIWVWCGSSVAQYEQPTAGDQRYGGPSGQDSEAGPWADGEVVEFDAVLDGEACVAGCDLLDVLAPVRVGDDARWGTTGAETAACPICRIRGWRKTRRASGSGGSATTARFQLSASGKGMVAVGIGEAGLEVGEMGVGATRVAAGIGLSFVVGVGSV